MNLLEQIDSDLNQAQKDRNESVRDTLRYVKSSLKNAVINKQAELTEQEVITVLQKEVKQRKDAISQYELANRTDLAEKELAEINIIEKYLPAQLADDELRSIIAQVIQETGATEPKDMGKIMSKVMPKVQGKADGSRVSSIAKELLSHE